MGKFKEKLPRSYKRTGTVIQTNVFQTNGRSGLLEERLANIIIFRKEDTKAILKRLALCSDMANSKDLPKAI